MPAASRPGSGSGAGGLRRTAGRGSVLPPPRVRSDKVLLALALASGIAGGATRGAVAESAEGTLRRSVTQRVWSCPPPCDSLEWNLPGRWILPASLRLTAGGETLRSGIDYELEAAEGILRLRAARPGARLEAVYEVLPLAVARVFQKPLPLDTTRVGSAPIPPKRSAAPERGDRARLELSGSKTVSLEVGTGQDLTVRQSLDVALSGEVITGVSVRGVLSDRETPLQPEGRTTELSDLDRVYLEVEGPGAQMTLGDFRLEGPPGLFTAYSRQLEGIWLRGRRGTGRVMIAAANLPGEYRSVEFLAEEGKQGPYELRPSGATLDAAILAGSERVWLDGELLVRGEDRDYLIDYAAATLTFTGRRVVGKDSRVTVDLQVSSQPFRRTTYSAEAGAGSLGGEGASRFGLRVHLLAEHDDRSHPIGGPLTEREREALEGAGDSLTVDLASGVSCGEAGSGDYQQVEADSLDRPFFRYVGAGLGSCRVRFDDVGERNGDYADSLLGSGDTIYRYVGFHQGRFLPGRAVPRPQQRDLLDLMGVWSGPSGMRLEAEGAGSLDDPNTLSGRDDSDRTGGALKLAIARETLPVTIAGRSIGRWGLALESRDVDSRFRAVGRLDPGWFGYEWGVSSQRLEGATRRRSATLRHEPGIGFAVEAGLEALSNLRDFEGTRQRLLLRRAGAIHGSLERSRTSSEDRAGGEPRDGERAIDALDLGVRTARLEGSLGLRRERTENGSGIERSGLTFDQWSAGGAYLLPASRGRFELRRTDRQDEELLGTGRRKGDRTRTWEGRALWSPTGRVLEATYTRRDLIRARAAPGRSDLASLLWSQESASRRFAQSARAELNTSEEEGRIRSIEYVGPGQGAYDSLGVYIGTGDYDLLLVPSGTKSVQRRLEGSWRVDLAPGRGLSTEPAGGLARLWSSSQWLLYTTVSARTSGSAEDFWSRLPDLLLARADGVPLASHRIRAEASALPQARWVSPQLRFTRERAREQLYENTQSRRENDLLSLTLRSAPGAGWTLEQEVEVDRDETFTRLLDGDAAEGAQGWRSRRLRSGAWWRLTGLWTLRLSASGRARERIPSGPTIRVYQLLPGIALNAAGKGRLDLAATRTWLDRDAGNLFGLERPGWEARSTASMRLYGSLDASASFELRAPDGGVTRTTARAELRALF